MRQQSNGGKQTTRNACERLFVYQGINSPVVLKKAYRGCLSGSERPAKKPDIDNVAKAFLDAMNGTVYLDDTQVVELNIKKVYSAVAGVDVAIMEAR
jgi:Holliday junction resolvase RusA-like endonuclease